MTQQAAQQIVAPIAPASAPRLPWPFVGAALVALVAIFISGKYFIGVPLFAVLFIVAHVVPWRLPDSKVLAWVLRATCWLLIIVTSPARRREGYPILFEPDYVYLFAFCCAAELTLRVWTHTARGPSRGEALLLTALIFVAATNTHNEHIRYLAPVYALLLLLSLRQMTFPLDGTVSGTGALISSGFYGENRDIFGRLQPQREVRPLFTAMRAAAMALALFLGGGISIGLSQYEYKIMNWASQFTRTGPRHGEIGLSASAMLGPVFNPRPSNERVLLIEGSGSERHLRAMAFDTYDERQWLPSVVGRHYMPMDNVALASVTDGTHLRFVRLTQIFDVLPLPLHTSGVISEKELDRDAFGSLRFHDESSLDIGYEAFVPKDEQHQGPMCVPLDEAHRRSTLAIPTNVDPKVRELAIKIAGDGEPLTKVIKLAQHLRSAHSYSLKYDPGSAEPLSDFILNNRSAHCQYFASAMVMLSRSIGVPARYVSGYYAHETYGDGLVVRERDAHAWTECFIEGTGWITMDATPSAGRPDVLFPDQPKWTRVWERITDLPRQFRDWLADINWARVTVVLVIVGVITLCVWAVVTLRSRKATTGGERPYAAVRAELQSAAARFEQWLASRGIATRQNRTWREQSLPNGSMSFVDAYDRARFGDDEAALHQMSALLEQLESMGG